MVNISAEALNAYINSFKGLTDSQQLNFEIKKEHSQRVAVISRYLAEKLELTKEHCELAYQVGLFHDIGRFQQLVEFNTFHDDSSVDHAELSVKIISEEEGLRTFDFARNDLFLKAIVNHNKFKLQNGLSEQELKFARLIRDADKLDILRVLTDYYSNRNATPNHTLTWDLPKGSVVSPLVAKDALAGKLVSKKHVASEIDVKIMQLSWVFDLNFKPSFELLFKDRYVEKIYNSLSKNDLVIEIYRKVKVYSENKILQ